jgi:hypothetical protein
MYVPTHPGKLGVGAFKIRNYHVPPEDGLGAYMAAFPVGSLLNRNAFPTIGGGVPFDINAWTETTGGTGDVPGGAYATTAGGGRLFTLASDDDFDYTIASKQVLTPASGQYWTMGCRFHVSAATGVGIKLGFATAAALPFGTNYTDIVGFSKDIASADLKAVVRGNSGTQSASAALATVADNTEVEVGFYAYIHATSPHGAFFVNGTETRMSSAQLTQLAAILTTPQSMYLTVHGTGVTGTNPTITVTSLVAEVVA